MPCDTARYFSPESSRRHRLHTVICAALADAGEIVLKDLAIYDGKAAPADYSLDLEVAAILKTADSTGFERSTWLAIPPAAPYRPL